MKFDFSGLGQTKLVPVDGDGCMPTGCADDPIHVIMQGFTAFSYAPKGCFTVLPEGEPLVATSMSADGALQHWFINPLNGELTMGTSQSVGTNASKSQFIGSFGGDWFAAGADLTVTNADLVAAAVAAAALVRKADGTSRPALVTDVISRIDVDLKPVGGHVDVAGVQTPTTASDAKHNRGGRVYDIDPGGSSSLGEMRDNDGFLLAANSGDIVIKAGSGVVISFDLASVPA